MPLSCLACFGGSSLQPDAPCAAPVEVKVRERSSLEAQRRDDLFLQELQAALSRAPTDSAEARIALGAAEVLRNLNAQAVRLYGWSSDETEVGTAGHLVLLAVDWKRTVAASISDPAAAAYKPPQPQLPDLPGQRIAIAMPPPVPAAAADSVTSLLQQAVHSKAPAVFSLASGHRPGTSPSSALPPDCAPDHANLGATSFAALALTSGDRLLGILSLSSAPITSSIASTKAPAPAPALAVPPPPPYGAVGLPPLPVLRQVANSVSMCLLGGVDPDYLGWLATCLRRLAASATLQAMVGELCEATAQHVRRRFLVDAVAHAAVVPDSRSTVGFMLDHRPQPGGPGGAARWGAAAASRQASITFPAGSAAAAAAAAAAGSTASGTGAGGSGLRGVPLSGQSDSFTNSLANGRTPQRTSSHAPVRGYPSQGKRTMTLVEQATSRAATTNAAAAAAASAGCSLQDGLRPSNSRTPTGGNGVGPAGHQSDAAAAAAAVASGVVPSLRAKGFPLSHTLLQHMVAGAEGRGPDGVYAGLCVADCGRHVQDVHQPSRDVCMLMAGGMRGADMTTDASDSNLFASERSTGRIAMQSLVLVGLDVGPGAGGQGADGGAVVALYLAFPTRLPPLLLTSAHASCRHLLSVMFSRLVRWKVASELEVEFTTLCAGVPGSYAVVPSTAHTQPPGGSISMHQAPGLLDGSGLKSDRHPGLALEPSIGVHGSIGVLTRASSCKLVPLGGVAPPGPVVGPALTLGASAQLLAAFTDAGCRAATQGSIGGLDTPRPGLATPEASGRVFVQTHDGSARNGRDGSALNGSVPISISQDVLFESHAEEEDASPTHEEAEVMLSSDPRIDEEGGKEGDGGSGVGRASKSRRGGGGDEEEEDILPVSVPDMPALVPWVPPTPAAVLTVSEEDGTSSMRQHMGLLVESLMSTLRCSAQIDDHFDSALVCARRSLDLELDDLRLSGVLGDGGSGVVLCGMLGTVPVAVKIIQMPEVDQLLLATTARVLGHPPEPGRQGGGVVAAANGGAAWKGAQGGGGAQVANGGGPLPALPPAPSLSLSSSKVKQARRDMLRNAMELAVMRSISHVNITTVYAVYDNVILERVKRDSGATAYALRRQGPEDMLLDKTGSKPVFVALCMELCDSGSLASKLEERSFPRLLQQPAQQPEEGAGGRSAARPRASRVLDMVGIYLTVLETACALRYLHARRLLHRDIKSANILLKASPTDPRGWTCKLADFGSALVLDQFQPPEELSQSEGSGQQGADGAAGEQGPPPPSSGRWFAIQEQSWGTITHMSPESMDNNSRVDASSDIFALGIVMWEITSGRGYRPYKELAPEQIGAAVRRGLRPTFTSEVPAPYRSLAQQCWAPEPHKRPSAVQLVAQVKAQLSLLQSEGRSQQQQQPPGVRQQQSPGLPRSPQPA